MLSQIIISLIVSIVVTAIGVVLHQGYLSSECDILTNKEKAHLSKMSASNSDDDFEE